MSLSDVHVFEDEVPLVRSCPQLNQFRLQHEHSDVTITLKDGSFLCAHKVILAARIRTLQHLLSGPSLSATKPAFIQWKDVSRTCADRVLQYIYTGQLEVDVEHATGVVTLARQLELPQLEKWVVSFLLERLDEGNLTTTWNFCQSLGIEPLATACIELIKETFQSFASSKLFTHLPATALLFLLREDDFRKRFYLVEQWINRPLTRGLGECPFRKSSRGQKRLLLIGQSRGGAEWLVQPYDFNSETDVPLVRVKERFSGAYVSVDGELASCFSVPQLLVTQPQPKAYPRM
ncbi:unnamed protein product [Dibothriocephalus latus]|uniref:BTB domain-containing protein n=1 Tax=Dibothriocephalus latus TaxID=60516 RepID=A0A3P7LV70_DIBLA|nr:unnamed protein product [Dibothriocephalus latus]